MWPSTRAARALATAFALAVVAGLAGFALWATDQRSPRLYRIGLVAPFEGLYRQTGYAALGSLRQQVNTLNGRLAGSGVQFQVWAVDDGNDPQLAARRAQELVADPLVLAVVGHYTPETGAAAAPTYADAGLVLVSPVAIAGTDSGQATTLSASPPPQALLQALQPASGGIFAGDAPLWPVFGQTLTPGDPLLTDGPLLALEKALVEGSTAASAVALPYSYCPEALVSVLPAVSFTIAVGPALDGSTAAATGRAAALALRLVEAASANGDPTRAGVAAAAQAMVAADGWQQSGPAAYAPNAPVAVLTCPPLP